MKKKLYEPPKRKIYTLLIIALSIFTLTLTALTMFAIHPSAGHRQTAISLARLDEKATTAQDTRVADEIYNSKEYKDLINSPENKYIVNTGIVTFAVGLILTAMVTIIIYRYLRKIRITRDSVSVTVWLSVVSGLITYFPGLYISSLIAGPVSLVTGTQIVFSLIALPFAILFSAIFTYIVAKITDNFYNRSHGFIED